MKRIRILVVFPLFLLSLPGCATFETLNFGYPEPPQRTVAEGFAYQDYQGVLHVHSRYSKSSKGYFDAIGREALKTHADFVVVSDHDTLKPLREKMEGFYGPVLVLIGNEVTTSAGHLFVMGIDRELDKEAPPEKILEDIRAMGGLSFVAHGEVEGMQWRDWSLSPLAGMEVYSLAEGYSRPPKPWLIAKGVFLPPKRFFRSIMREPKEAIARWDSMLKEKPFVGIGSTDAHQKISIFDKPIDDYGPIFWVVQTHAWASDLSKPAILDAFRKGHVYIALGILAPCRNFLFTAEGSRGKALMGDTITYETGMSLKAVCPRSAEIRLLRDGTVVRKVQGRCLALEAPGSGVYRVEAYLNGELWILSNPIYVR